MEGEGQQINQVPQQTQPPIEQTPPVAGQGYVAPKPSFVEALTTRSVANLASWLLLFLLAPATILVLISQNTVPGDFFYPVKRGLEGVVLAAASVHPSTKAAFRVDLQARRFTEAETLLLTKADTAGLSEFVSEVKQTQAAVAQVSDPVKKQELQQKLQEAYNEYEKRLVVVKVQLEAQQGVQPAQPSVTTSPEPTSAQAKPTNTPVPPPAGGPTSLPGQPPRPTNTPVPLPTSTPKPQPTALPPGVPTSVPTRETPTPIPTQLEPTPIAPPSTPGGAIDATTEYLRCLQTRPHHECREPDIPQQHLQSERRPKDRQERPEVRRQLREVREERGEKRESGQSNRE